MGSPGGTTDVAVGWGHVLASTHGSGLCYEMIYGASIGAAQPRAVQQGLDGRITRRHSWLFSVVILTGGEQCPHLAGLQRSAARQP